MKPISQLLARSALVCLSLIPAALAGPGGTYGPSAPGYGPYNNNYGNNNYGGYNSGYNNNNLNKYNNPYDGGGFGGGFSHRGYDHYQPTVVVSPPRTYGPTKPSTVKIVEPNRSEVDIRIQQPHFDHISNRNPVVVVQPNPRVVNNRAIIQTHRPNYYTGGWYHGDWHSNWSKSLQGRPYAWAGWGNGWNGWNGKLTPTVATSPWRFGYWSYNNPYYTNTANVPSYFNYSQPIIASNITADASGQFYPQAMGQGSRDQAMQLFNGARQAFFAGDFRRAQGEIDQAIAILPSDTVLHEFRGLVLFARRDYTAAAGAVYAVLSSGPGWDWTTMIGLYPNSNVYTAQLRVLEDYCNATPGAANARFLLGYHYLTAGYTDAAAEMYRQVVAINPRDSLSGQLLASLSGSSPNQVAQLPQFDPQGINPQFLTGNWAATRDDGSTFQLSLRPDGFFTWVYNQNGMRQQMQGGYSLTNGTLTLQQDGQPAMVGQIYQLAGNRFVFKLVGGDPYDPGLTFYR